MSRLPTPGSDDNQWGAILNDFLVQAHNADGTIKNIGIVAAKADDAAVVHNTTNETIAGTKTFSASPIVPTPTLGSQTANKTYVDATTSAGAPDATTTNKGLVQLAGDLSGTATTPTVPGLAIKATDSTVVHNTGAETIAGVKTFSSTITGNISGNAATVTTNANLTGDVTSTGNATTLANTANVQTVVRINRLDQMAAPTAAVPLNSQKITGLANGSAATDAAAFGQIPTGLPPTGAAGGDLNGTYPSPTVAKVNGVTISGTPSSGQIVTATSGTAASWATPAAGVNLENSVAPPSTNTTGSVVGVAATAARADHTHIIGAHASTHTGGTDSLQRAWVTSVMPARPATGEFLVSSHTGTSTTVGTTLNTMYMMPIDVAVATTFSGIASNISVVGAGTGLAIRLGYYADDTTGAKPTGSALIDAGTFDPTVTTGDRLIAFGANQTLQPNRYWLALALQGTAVTTAPTLVSINLVNQIGLTNLGNNNYRTWAMSGVPGALPTLGTLFRATTNPIIALKVA